MPGRRSGREQRSPGLDAVLPGRRGLDGGCRLLCPRLGHSVPLRGTGSIRGVAASPSPRRGSAPAAAPPLRRAGGTGLGPPRRRWGRARRGWESREPGSSPAAPSGRWRARAGSTRYARVAGVPLSPVPGVGVSLPGRIPQRNPCWKDGRGSGLSAVAHPRGCGGSSSFSLRVPRSQGVLQGSRVLFSCCLR